MTNEIHARMEEGTFFFCNTLSSMAAQKAANALRTHQRFNGKVMSRAAWVLANLENVERIDHDKQRVYFKTGTFFFFKDITKTAVDFIEYLNSCKEA